MNKKVAVMLVIFTLTGCGQSLEDEVLRIVAEPESVELKDLRRSKDGKHICGMIQTRNLANQISIPWTRFSTIGKEVQVVHPVGDKLWFGDEYRQRCL